MDKSEDYNVESSESAGEGQTQNYRIKRHMMEEKGMYKGSKS